MRPLLAIFLLLFSSIELSAQIETDTVLQKSKNSLDTLIVRGHSFLLLNDSLNYIEKDTFLILPDSTVARLKKDNSGGNELFYSKIKEKLYKKKFTKELYNLLFVDTPKATTKQTVRPQANLDERYDKFEGKRIKSIRIKKLEVFGTSIKDTTKHTDSWAINLANDFHSYTKKAIVKNNIYFEEGDLLNSDQLKDSERVLRNLPYIKDARIFVTSNSEEEEVELLILVKDIWSISGEIKYSRLDKFSVALIDKNLFGLGQELRNEFLYDGNNTPNIGYRGIYSINNIYKSFISAELHFARSEPLDRIGVRFFREFITPETKYAGGIAIFKDKQRLERIYQDTTVSFFTNYVLKDTWFGRSFLIDQRNDGARTNIQLAGRYSHLTYSKRPTVEIDTNQQFFNRNLYLFSVGVTRRAYEKSSLIAGFGRTEDIPNGYLAEFTMGREANEFYNRTYLGWRFAYGSYARRLGYFRQSLSLGGFINDGNIEQGIIKAELQYFSFLYRINNLKLRQFFSLGVSVGINRFDNEYININDNNGIRGLSNTLLRGTRKASFSSETVAFTSFYLIGFRFAPFIFADLGVVNVNNSKLLKNQVYQGYGIGFRLRNENLAFNTIQIRLAWYPVTPPETSQFDFELTGSNSLGINDFQTGIPSTIEFN